MTAPEYFRWKCPACRYEEQTAADELFRRLQKLGLMKRAEEPDADVALELARAASDRLTCPRCRAGGFQAERSTAIDGDDDWGDAKPCAACGKMIPAERVALFPTVELCASCQKQLESGRTTAGDDYCPRCGTPMEMRHGRGAGISKYQLVCPSCRR